MKIAITTTGKDLNSPLCERFGRTPFFMVYDTESDSFEVFDNSVNLNAPQGAGLQTAQNIARQGVSCVITGHCGPKAFFVLQKAGIKVFLAQNVTVKDAIAALKDGKLQEAKAPDVEGHW
ncbi:MAG: NifB/NifX family molybdenum-iron cluster-binding protein [Thermodesulforhabdaceae bacterium]